ncbi:hypothetical protein [Pyruvatibacter mobilis]
MKIDTSFIVTSVIASLITYIVIEVVIPMWTEDDNPEASDA